MRSEFATISLEEWRMVIALLYCAFTERERENWSGNDWELLRVVGCSDWRVVSWELRDFSSSSYSVMSETWSELFEVSTLSSSS